MRMANALCKTSVRIWKPLRKGFDKLLARNGLKRDAFLNLVLAVEIPALDAEVKKANSPAARRYIAQRLKALHPQPLVTLRLRADLVRQLDRICADKRICRDAFFNRLLFLLTANRQTIDKIFFNGDGEWRTGVWSECKHDGPFFQRGFFPLTAEVNPFWAVRAGIELWNQESRKSDELLAIDSIYEAPLWNPDGKSQFEELKGLSCYLPDHSVVGTAANKEFYAMLEAFTGQPRSFWRAA